ncbi:MAG: HD domain-containing phosphohydrolase [Candidatus Omnitrophota bacterium]
MLDKIERTFRDLIFALQIARMYPDWHPEFKNGIEKAHVSLGKILSGRTDLVIGIIGEELAFEKEIFFDLSKNVKPTIILLKERGVERIQFLPGLDKEELAKFVIFLVTPKDKITLSPQEYLDTLGVRNIIVGKIKAAAIQSTAYAISEADLLNYFKVYEKSFDELSKSIESVLNGEELNQLVLRDALGNVMDSLMGRYQDLLNLAKLKRYDLKTFYHTVNVAILSMFFSFKLGFTKQQVLDIGVAALLHDTGKLAISRKLIQKPSRLNEKEFTKMKSHVTLGAEMLLKYIDRLGVLPVVVCFEHHLKYNLKGYPKVSFYKKLHTASMIVSICDVYDALSQRRNYKRDYPPNLIYELMAKEKGEDFDPELLDKFFQIIGVWPVGTIVSLNDGRIAVVREQNRDDKFSPKVEVILPKDKKEIVDLKAAKDKLKIERSLNPLGEGKDYLALIYPNL